MGANLQSLRGVNNRQYKKGVKKQFLSMIKIHQGMKSGFRKVNNKKK